MAKFKVGDRVRVLVDTTDVKQGQRGTVREESSNPWIHFDTETKYDGEVNLLNIPAGYADCPWEGFLELITDPVDNSERDELAKNLTLTLCAGLPAFMSMPQFENVPHGEALTIMAFDLADAYMAEKARRNNG